MPSQRPRLTRRLPFAVFGALLVILVLAVALGVNAWQTARAHRAAAEAALQEYATFAAWTYRYRVEANHYFVATRVFDAVGGIHPDVPDHNASPAVLMTALDNLRRCGCAPPVVGRFAFRMDVETGKAVTAGPALPDSAGLDHRFDLVRKHCKEFRGGVDWAVVSGDDDGVPWEVFYTIRRKQAEGTGTVYGFEVDLASIQRTIYDNVFRNEPLLPVARRPGRPINAGLSVEVQNYNGTALYRSEPQYASSYQGEIRVLRNRLGTAYSIRAVTAIDPAAADEMLIGGLPRSPMPLVVVLILATSALVLVATFFTWRSAELVRAREEFTSSVSHELRTPLTQILLYAELLLLNRMRSAPERRGALDVIVRESRRLIHLVENVLQFSVSAHRIGAAGRTQSLAPIVEEVLAGFEPQLRSRNITVERSVDPTVSAKVDADALRQVLINFLDNAARHGPESQTLTIGVERSDRGARLWVRDQGPGIPPGDQARIWQPFVRLSGTEAGGSGIGLAVVRQLVELQGGRYGVESDGRSGATFFAEFPGEGAEAGEAIA